MMENVELLNENSRQNISVTPYFMLAATLQWRPFFGQTFHFFLVIFYNSKKSAHHYVREIGRFSP